MQCFPLHFGCTHSKYLYCYNLNTLLRAKSLTRQTLDTPDVKLVEQYLDALGATLLLQRCPCYSSDTAAITISRYAFTALRVRGELYVNFEQGENFRRDLGGDRDRDQGTSSVILLRPSHLSPTLLLILL